MLVIVVAYLVGSIPFGYLIVRATQGTDIRETGSGGTGATNVSRRAGKTAGVLTLVLDALKGAAAVLIASWVLNEPVLRLYSRFANNELSVDSNFWWIAGSAVAVILGHMFPVWLGFRGGKGVATGVGVFLILSPIPVAFAGVVFLIVVWGTRYVSLGSIIAAVMIPGLIWVQHMVFAREDFVPLITAATVIAVLIIFAHRANIQRLLKGTESKLK